MATVTLQFPRSQYPSLQIGDIAYYAIMNPSLAGFQINDVNQDLIEIGTITIIDDTTALEDGTLTTSVTCNIDDETDLPTTNNFIFFAKDNRANLTSPLGYYASIKFRNQSTDKAEMFSVGCEISESSK